MFLGAISNPGEALRQAAVILGLLGLVILGVIWLTIAFVLTLTLWMPTAAASAITGGGLLGIALTALWLRHVKSAAHTPDEEEVPEEGEQDLFARGTHLAERLAPGSPMLALGVAIGTGWASVSCPPALDPVISQILKRLEHEMTG